MAKWGIDRTAIFLSVIGLLFFWDLAYFVGLRDPARFPHPFRIFRLLGDFELLRGFLTMLRQIIFYVVSGGVIGIAVGSLVLRNARLTLVVLRLLCGYFRQ